MKRETPALRSWLREHWLILLIAAQPALDVLAYFTRNEVATPAGYLRLLILLAMPVTVLIRTPKKGRFLLEMGAIALYCLLHLANDFRVGVISLYFELAYMIRVVQMPVLAICFVYLIRDEQTRSQGFRGILIAAGLTAAFLLLAFVTGTGSHTYSEGYGFSGWVISDNRCANSILLVTLSVFCAAAAIRSRNRLVTVLIPALIALAFLTNGTKACYYSIFGIFAAFLGWIVIEKPLHKTRFRWLAALVLLLLMGFSVLIYPYTPRYKISQVQTRSAAQGEIEAAVAALGYDLDTMSTQERFDTPEVKAVFEHYYWKYLGVLPDLIDRFGMDRVLLYYDMSTDVERLIDVRVMERAYSALIWEDCDVLTRLLGFEVSEIGFNGTYDMENDWPAVFYYYGYLGFALYAGFLLLFIARMLRTLLRDFRGSMTIENFSLFLCLALQLGLAQFSGALVRRPNVSIYLSLILGLIWFQTAGKEERA